jgi:hypothetical protein
LNGGCSGESKYELLWKKQEAVNMYNARSIADENKVNINKFLDDLRNLNVQKC